MDFPPTGDPGSTGVDGAGSSAPPPSPGSGRLGRLALRGSLFEVLGYGGSQLLRLVSNLILTRLLYPQAFGLVAIVNIFNTGLVLLSDVGIEPAVIQSPHGDDRRFLDTAWSIQVVRGFVLYGVALCAAWPMARFYREPELLQLLMVGSLAVALGGFHSTSLYALRRRLAIGKLTVVEISAQLASMAVMLPWAWIRPSVWALVAGSLTYPAFRSVASYALDEGVHNRFRFHLESRKAIQTFGKWIFLSSAVYFVARQGDRLLLGRFMGVAELGVYSVAVMLSDAISVVTTRVTQGVIFPVLSRVREEGSERLREVYYRARLVMDGLTMPALGGLTVLGNWVVNLLYDRRYAQAGWMLQALAFRVAMTCILTPCETTLFASGKTRYSFYSNVVRLVWMVVTIPLGAHFWGIAGLVAAVATSELPVVLVLWIPAWRLGLLRPLLELRSAFFYCLGAGAGWLLLLVLPWRQR